MCEPMMSLSLTKNYKLSTCVYLHLEKQKLQKKKKRNKNPVTVLKIPDQ